MALEEVQELVKRFNSNMEKITSLHRLVCVLERNYRDFWTEVRRECEATHHDEVVAQREMAEFRSLQVKKDAGVLCDASEIRRYLQLKSKREQNNKQKSRGCFCPYCNKKLSETHSFWEDSFPSRIYRIDFLKQWLQTKPEEWPEEKRDLLIKIKNGIGDYLNMAVPLQEQLKVLTEDQISTRAEITEIFALCKAVLHITDKTSNN